MCKHVKEWNKNIPITLTKENNERSRWDAPNDACTAYEREKEQKMPHKFWQLQKYQIK